MNGVRSNWEVDALLRQQKEKLQSKRAQRAEARMRHEAEKKLLKSQVDKKVVEAATRRRKGKLNSLEGIVVLERHTDTSGDNSKPALDEAIDLQLEYENMVELNDRYMEEKLRVSHQLYDKYDRLKFLLEENKRHKAANAQLVRQTNQQHREMEAALADKRLELAIEQHKRKERDAETAKANANAQVPTEQVDVADNGLQEDEEAPRFTLQELSDRIRTEERNIRTYHRKITNTKENLRKNKTDLQQKELKYNAIVAQRDEKEIRRQELEVKISSLRKELGT